MVILVEEAQLALTMIGDRMKEDDRGERFEGFVLVVEPKLRRALIARYGRERGREATAEALAWAWQHWSRLEGVENPVAFLYRVGQTRSRQRQAPPIVERPGSDDSLFEPGLAAALAALPERQRVAVLLVHGAEWTHAEVADLLGVGTSTVQTHVERGRARLRQLLKVSAR